MSKKLKIALIIIALAVAAALAYYFYKKKKSTAAPVITPAGTPPGAETAALPTDNDNFPLQLGSQGKNVLYLQRALNMIRPENNLLEDGKLGAKTQTALWLSVSADTARLPMDEKRFNKIIAEGNKAVRA